MPETNVMEFDAVGLRYGQGAEVLRDVSFALPAGSFHFLTGESGAGKTSLLSLLYLTRAPTRGTVRLFGRDVRSIPRGELPELRRQISFVFQDFRLLDHLSAVDNVALPLRVAGYDESDVRKRVSELLIWVGLGAHLNAKPPTLSGGQKQSVAIARAIVTRPRILLADEPTGNLDDRSAARLMRLFVELNRHGTTVVIATHNEGLIKSFAYPRMHLSNGRLAIYPVGYTPDFSKESNRVQA